MPGYDGRGPRGAGSMTGGGRGYCAMPASGFTSRPRTGMGFGRGGSRGCRNRYYVTGLTPGRMSSITPASEKEALREEAELLKRELSDIQSRISELENDKN